MISIIITVYNSASTIIETLESIVPQMLSTDELIIVDDCSSDATVSIVEKWLPNDIDSKVIKLNSNSGGPAHPRNVGMSYSNKEYVAFCDSDDLWHPNKLEIQRGLLVGVDLLCSEMFDFYDRNDFKWSSFSIVSCEILRKKRFYYGNPIPLSTVIARRSALEKFGFNEDSRFKAVEDYDLWFRFARYDFLMTKIKLPLLAYRKSGGQISANKWKQIKRVFLVLKTNCGILKALVYVNFYAVNGALRMIRGVI